MNPPWTDSWAFWTGILAWMFGGIYLAWSWIRRPGGGEGPGSLAPRPHMGPARAIAPLLSPGSGHECVYYAEIDKTDELAEKPLSSDPAERECGAFLVDAEGGTLLVWPTGGEVTFSDGWSGRDFPGKTVYEKYVSSGSVVTVAGGSGSFADMMSEMSGAAADLPPDLLRALQTREDLRALRCFWGHGTFVSEGVPSEADEIAAPWLDILAAGVCMLFGTVLLYLSYTHFL